MCSSYSESDSSFLLGAGDPDVALQMAISLSTDEADSSGFRACLCTP